MERPAPVPQVSDLRGSSTPSSGRSHNRKEPAAMSSVTHSGPIHLGLDVHKDSIPVAVLPWGQEPAEVEKIVHDEPSVRRLVARFPDPGRLRVYYEAGPTGYELPRLLARLRVRCDVVAPSLTPKAPGDRIKTDRRDAPRLARPHRAGELVAIPTGTE